MAAPEPRVRERPLSPHLQVYRWQVQMVTSILHRATGVILSVGALALVYGLLALAGGPARWNAFALCLASPLGKLLMFGFSWALAYHLLNGIRHLLWDAGWGFAIPTAYKTGYAVFVLGFAITGLIWYCGLRGGA